MRCRRQTSCCRRRPSPRLPHRLIGPAGIGTCHAIESRTSQVHAPLPRALRDSGNLAWSVGALIISIISLIAIAPVLAIGVLALQSSGDTWSHLIADVLPARYAAHLR